MRVPVLLLLMLTSVFLMDATSMAQPDPDYQLSLSSGTGNQGTSVDLTVTFDNTGAPARSWAFGVCSDAALVSVIDVIAESGTNTSNNGNFPDLAEIYISSEGWATGVIIDTIGGNGLGPGLGYVLNRASYLLEGAPGSDASIEFCVYPSAPPITPFINLGGMSVVPVMNDGTISIVSRFVRGECNGSSPFDLADPIFLLTFLFIDPTAPPCFDACDANDDGSLNLADVIYQLSHLFNGGPPPLPPTSLCEEDPTDDGLDCQFFGACP